MKSYGVTIQMKYLVNNSNGTIYYFESVNETL